MNRDLRDRLAAAVEAVDTAGVFDESAPMEAVLAAARDVLAADRAAIERDEQRMATKMPRILRADGVWTTVSPAEVSGTSVRMLPDAATFYFQFTDDAADDYQAHETSVLLRAMSDWIAARPHVVPLLMGTGLIDARCHGFLTVEGAPDEDIAP